jgi:hypothetical protein
MLSRNPELRLRREREARSLRWIVSGRRKQRPSGAMRTANPKNARPVERSLNKLIGLCQGPKGRVQNIKPMPHFRRLKERESSIPKDWSERVPSGFARCS